jgi:hypothetical protein
MVGRRPRRPLGEGQAALSLQNLGDFRRPKRAESPRPAFGISRVDANA